MPQLKTIEFSVPFLDKIRDHFFKIIQKCIVLIQWLNIFISTT